MNNASCMEMLNAAKHLIEQIRKAFVVQIHLNDLAQIRVHQFHHNVQITEIVERFLRSECVQKADYLQ